jgi:hypothetical protein
MVPSACHVVVLMSLPPKEFEGGLECAGGPLRLDPVVAKQVQGPFHTGDVRELLQYPVDSSLLHAWLTAWGILAPTSFRYWRLPYSSTVLGPTAYGLLSSGRCTGRRWTWSCP